VIWDLIFGYLNIWKNHVIKLVNKKIYSKDIELSLIDSVAVDKLKDILLDLSEVGIDTILNNDLIKSIPIVGIISKIYGATVSVREHIFLRKVLSFLSETSNSSDEDRKNFLTKISRTKGLKEKIASSLLLRLDRLDDMDKPKLIGRIYTAHILEKISLDEMNRFTMIVDNLYLPDLIQLAKLNEGDHIDDISGYYCNILGIAKMTGIDLGSLDGIGGETWFEINELGNKFLSAVFSNQDAKIS